MEVSTVIAIGISAFTTFALGLVMYLIKMHWAEIKSTQLDIKDRDKARVDSVKEVHARVDETNRDLNKHITDSRVHQHSH